jgi:D-alanyl-D-alanine dipeptidase
MLQIRLLIGGIIIVLSGCAEERRSAIVVNPSAGLAAQYDLVDVRTYLPDVSVDLRYATRQNIAHQPLYPPDMPCLLHRSTALKLKKAQEKLKPLGYAIRIWDAWRPPEVQVELMHKGGGTGMFLDPRVGWSRHCCGSAVDLTLIDLEGREQRMPSAHDENSDRAYFQYSGGDPVVKRNVEVLQHTMRSLGFTTIDLEWWHFDDSGSWTHPKPEVYARQIGLHLPLVH